VGWALLACAAAIAAAVVTRANADWRTASREPVGLAPDPLAPLFGRNDNHGKVAIRDVVAQCSAEAYNGGAFPRDDGSVGLLHHDAESVGVADPGLPSDRGEECPD